MMYYCKRAVKKSPGATKSIFHKDHYIKYVCKKVVERKPQEADTVDYSSVLGIYNHTDVIFGGRGLRDVCCTTRTQNRKEFTLRATLGGIVHSSVSVKRRGKLKTSMLTPILITIRAYQVIIQPHL